MVRTSWLGGLLLAASLLPATAWAQVSPADKAAAEALFEEGRKLAAAGNYREAIAKFEASQRLDAGLGTMLYLADAYEQAGRTASAWATFREAAAFAKQTNQGERETVARNRAAALEPKLARLTITIDPDAAVPGLEVRRNGTPIKRELLNAPVPVDPGTYLVEATAPGKKPFSAKIEVPDGPTAMTLTVPALADVETVASTPTSAAPSPAPATPSGKDEATGDGDDGSGRRTLGLIVGGVGLAGLAMGGVLVAVALSRDAEADEHCNGVVCNDQEGVDLADSANTLADVAGIALGVGAAALVGGAVLYLTAPSISTGTKTTGARRSAWSFAPIVGPRSAGLAMGARF